MRKWRLGAATAVMAAILAAGAQAQLLGGVGGGIGALPGQVVGGLLPGGAQPGAQAVGGVVDTLSLDHVSDGLDRANLLDLRRQRLRALIAGNRTTLEADEDGVPVRRGEVIALDPALALIARATAAGFTVLREQRIEGLDIAISVLRAPRGENASKALTTLRRVAPDANLTLNHIFEPAGGALATTTGLLAGADAAARGERIGMIDGGVASHPAFAGAAIEQRGFVPGAPKPTGHGTAVASLLVGNAGPFRGAAPGHPLLAADVYGGDPAAGSAEAIAAAIGWLIAQQVRVITISLVGPPDALIARAVAAAAQRGVTIVAAVGNDGPAAPPQYPASYPQAVAVTGVDARGRALAEAGRASHLDFAAPGADMAAATPLQGYALVRGTSFAAPLVAARIAASAGPAAARLAALATEARPGRGRVGRGIVCGTCRTPPDAVRARR